MKPLANLTVSEFSPSSSGRSPTTLNVAIVGFGTVGSSVARILSERSGADLRLTHIFNRQIARKRVGGLPETIRWTEVLLMRMSSLPMLMLSWNSSAALNQQASGFGAP